MGPDDRLEQEGVAAELEAKIDIVPDSRKVGIGIREVSGLYYQTLKSRAKDAEMNVHGRFKGRTRRLMSLLEGDKQELSRMRAAAREVADDGDMLPRAHGERIKYLDGSPNQREAKGILLELELAEMLLLGDWKVNREGGERAPVDSPMPGNGELRREILAEAEVLSRALRIGDANAITAKATHIGNLLHLSTASAAAVALRELNQEAYSRKTSQTEVPEICDIAVSASVSNDITSSMGIAPFNEIESLILQFHCDNGLLANMAPISEGKLVALDLGCGNGVTGERLRRDSTDPFNNGYRLVNYWSEIGFADKIYWTISDLLYSLLRDEHKNDHAILEFIEVVSILLIRKINYLKHYPPQKLSKEDENLLNLPGNPNLIRVILPNLDRYIKKFQNLRKIKADKEFLSDSDYVLSESCRGLIQDFFDGPALFKGISVSKTGYEETALNEMFGPSISGKRLSARAFCRTYFRDEAIEEDKLEKEIVANQDEINTLEARYSEIAARLKYLKGIMNTETTALIEQRKHLKREIDRLVHEKKELEKQRVDLSGEITIYPHNVVLGDFAKFKDIMPDAQIFDWVRSCRATSHADDKQYAELIYECAYRLKPGGIITEDGKRESYTRFERINELQDLQQKLGGEYRVSLIAKPDGPVGVLIERAVVRKDGEIVFFSDQKGQQILRDDAQLVPVDMFAARWPEMAVRNEIIKRLKGLFIDSVLQDCPLDDVSARTYRGRMQFRDLHRSLDIYLDDKVFKTDRWRELSAQHFENFEFERIVEEVWEVISKEITKVRERINVVTSGAALLKGEDAVIRTFPPGYAIQYCEKPEIEAERSCAVTLLPRNLDIPDLSAPKLEEERRSLIVKLTEIAKLTGRPPLRLHLYDCFTDVAMLDTILILLGVGIGADKELEGRNLLEVANTKIGGSFYPEYQDGVIDIFGGSTRDAYDRHGQNYIDGFVVPWLRQIDNGAPARGLGICFGSQCVLKGIGKLKGFDVKTQRGALQFGPFPVVFDDRHIAVKHLAKKVCTSVFTRSGYSVPEDNAVSRSHLRPLAYEGKMTDSGIWLPDTNLPPVAYSLLDGRVITAQFHPEIRLGDSKHLKPLRRFVGRYAKNLSRNFARQGAFWSSNPLASPNYLMRNHFELRAENVSGGNTNWVAKDIGMAFLIPSLLHLVNGLLVDLRKSKH